MKAGKFPNALEISVWGMPSPLVFGSASKLVAWAEDQKQAWAEVSAPSGGPWSNAYGEQQNYFAVVAGAAARYRESVENVSDPVQINNAWTTLISDIQGVVSAIREGRTLTVDAPMFTRIKAVSKVDPDAAALLLYSQRADWNQQLQYAQQQGPHFIRALIGVAGAGLPKEIDPEVHAAEVQSLKAQLRADSENFDGVLNSWKERFSLFDQDQSSAAEKRAIAWGEELEGVKGDWQALKKTYDEQLALQAPTQYWKDRERNAIKYSIAFGVSFLTVAALCMTAFVWLGIPYLHDVAEKKDVSVLVLAIPVLVPGFVGIWILRILGRLFAENLQLSIDAGERQTMVKTFLALMHDANRGKALVTDDDRILILHSLFRPSAVSSADDAPPVHWFDILSQKLGGPKK